MRVNLFITDQATPKLLKDSEEKIGIVATRLRRAADFLLREIQKNCEPSPNYSLRQLRQMGHPYAKRHYSQSEAGEWFPRPGTPAENIHDPWWQVNRQSGQLRRALSASSVDMTIPGMLEVRIGVPDTTEAYRYARYVIYGTKKMVPRNFIIKTTLDNLDIIRSLLLK